MDYVEFDLGVEVKGFYFYELKIFFMCFNYIFVLF